MLPKIRPPPRIVLSVPNVDAHHGHAGASGCWMPAWFSIRQGTGSASNRRLGRDQTIGGVTLLDRKGILVDDLIAFKNLVGVITGLGVVRQRNFELTTGGNDFLDAEIRDAED